MDVRRIGRRTQRRWVTWALSFAAAYSLAIAFLAFVAPRTAAWPLPIRAAILPLVVFTLLTNVITPAITRLTGGRYGRGDPSDPSNPCRGRETPRVDGKEAPRTPRTNTPEQSERAERVA